MEANETFFSFRVETTGDIVVEPYVDKQKVLLMDYYGGHLTIDKPLAKKGDNVNVTVKPKEGNTFKKFRTVPDNAVEFKQVKVDEKTGERTYSFVMPTSYLTLRGEYYVTLNTEQEIDSISKQHGTFRLGKDLTLTNWNAKEITLIDEFDGNGHQITYAGNSSLFHTVDSTGSVRHLYVNANVNGTSIGDGSNTYLGGICSKNKGVIEDCVVTGSVKNQQKASFAGGIAGLNGNAEQKATIAYCHVLCDGLDAPTNFGVAQLGRNSIIKGNVFSGAFVAGDRRNYMVCNDQDIVNIEENYYIPSAGNARGELCRGVTAKTPDGMTDVINQAPKDCYVYLASLKSKYVGGYPITFTETDNVKLASLSAEAANAGTRVTVTVRVEGNNHLESVTVAGPQGTTPFQCPFIDNTENVYTFSFTMPAHEVTISATTQPGVYIYTASQFALINEQPGIFYLARDIDLNNWEKGINLKGTFHGQGHTIRFHADNNTTGLFHLIAPEALLEGLRVAGTIETGKNCGGIAFENKGIIRNCHFSGQIKRLGGTTLAPKRLIAAIVLKNSGDKSIVEYCSATGVLINEGNQKAVDKKPLYGTGTNNKMVNCIWVNDETPDTELQKAQSLLHTYPVYAQGILDRMTPRIVTGNKTQTVAKGQTLDELTIIDGEPFHCTSDVKVKRVIYKRKTTKKFDQWVLPFAFNRMTGNCRFTYGEVIEKNSQPALGSVKIMTLSDSPQEVNYTFNKPWLVKNDSDGDENTYVLSNANGSPITIQATTNHRVARYKSALDSGNFFAAYDTVPAKVVNDELMYVWNGELGEQGEFVISDGLTSIQPNRFYLQFFNNYKKKVEKYAETEWAKMEKSKKVAAKAPRRLAEAVSDGWQPVFLDPREPQSITERLLDYYDIAYLADIRGEDLSENMDKPLAAVSLVYMMADGYMELPPALPLLVRAKRSDATPLVDEKVAAELDELLTKMMEEEEQVDESETYDDEWSDFDLMHYWCGSFDNRLDVWQLPAPESYADLAEYGCMVFNDNDYDQSFLYAKANDTRSTSPMSYCITLLNANTYELLPLLGDRVFVEFLQIAEDEGDVTGISLTPDPFSIATPHSACQRKGEGSGYTYNLNGQRVSKPTKGLYIVNGRKVVIK